MLTRVLPQTSKPQKGKKAHPVLELSLKTSSQPNQWSQLMVLPPKHQLGRARLVLHTSVESERQANAAKGGAAEKETAERKEAELQAQAQAEITTQAELQAREEAELQAELEANGQAVEALEAKEQAEETEKELARLFESRLKQKGGCSTERARGQGPRTTPTQYLIRFHLPLSDLCGFKPHSK
jgi:hypothetical protein